MSGRREVPPRSAVEIPALGPIMHSALGARRRSLPSGPVGAPVRSLPRIGRCVTHGAQSRPRQRLPKCRYK
ncbi:unnamed protein product, partial [Iphiclides podalirius]